jgi:S1-C subfamily serine protease
MYDTPAFRGNLFPGDIIIALDSTPIESALDFMAKVDDFAGKSCEISILREGKEIVLTVRMNPKPI